MIPEVWGIIPVETHDFIGFGVACVVAVGVVVVTVVIVIVVMPKLSIMLTMSMKASRRRFRSQTLPSFQLLTRDLYLHLDLI